MKKNIGVNVIKMIIDDILIDGEPRRGGYESNRNIFFDQTKDKDFSYNKGLLGKIFKKTKRW